MDEKQVREKIMTRLGLPGLSQERQDALINQINEAVLQRIFLTTVEHLSPDDQEIFAQKMEDETINPEDMDTFLRSAIADYDKMLTDTSDSFFAEITNFVGTRNSSPTKNHV